jgi:CRISPR-associated protein Cmr1
MNTREITATFEIVTPMFLGDGDQEARIIRPQSFKAELLFWWRALHFAGYVGASEPNDHDAALDAMHSDETLLFGGADGQAAFLIRVEHEKLKILDKGKVLLKSGGCAPGALEDKSQHTNRDAVGPSIRYLGYGVMKSMSSKINPELGKTDPDRGWREDNIESYAGELIRSAIAPGQCFCVKIIFRTASRNGDKARLEVLLPQLLDALQVTGLLGGLGSRKRRGFGSMALLSLVHGGELLKSPLEQRQAYEDCLSGKLKGRFKKPGKLFPLSAFADDSQLRLGGSSVSAMDAMLAIGKEFQEYRGWGFGTDPKVNGVPSRKNFTADHNWFKLGHARPAASPSTQPERAMFGLPHNYYSGGKSDGSNVKMKLDIEPFSSGRRASPLLFHVARAGSDIFAVATYLDTRFLTDDGLKYDGDNKHRHAFVPSSQVVSDYLNGGRTSGATGGPNASIFTTKVLP